jgi:hypothetical protein
MTWLVKAMIAFAFTMVLAAVAGNLAMLAGVPLPPP